MYVLPKNILELPPIRKSSKSQYLQHNYILILTASHNYQTSFFRHSHFSFFKNYTRLTHKSFSNKNEQLSSKNYIFIKSSNNLPFDLSPFISLQNPLSAVYFTIIQNSQQKNVLIIHISSSSKFTHALHNNSFDLSLLPSLQKPSTAHPTIIQHSSNKLLRHSHFSLFKIHTRLINEQISPHLLQQSSKHQLVNPLSSNNHQINFFATRISPSRKITSTWHTTPSTYACVS